MGKGIALQFRNRFGSVDVLKSQNLEVGETAIIVTPCGRTVCYLITKKKYFNKPSYRSIYLSLLNLREKIIQYNLKKIALPKIACGLDRKNWGVVKVMLQFIFRGVDVEICIFY